MRAADFRANLRAARRGDEQAWRALYDWIAPQVLGFLRASRVPDAEDVLGDVFLEVARRIGRFQGDAGGFRAWVFTIARARRVDELRRRSRRDEEAFDPGAHEVFPSRVDVEGEALAMVGLENLLGLLDQLTDDQSEVLILRAIGGWTSREIGEITGRTTGAVEQLQHRATRALRDLLDGA
ncbi:MAG TPA: sigma-70 family RNA polymerase sigma factor [Acidimicrobiia bacterium]|nr:sigma-70 family RNA polymerase sigma factor [Acidimicrobiia bacterium]